MADEQRYKKALANRKQNGDRKSALKLTTSKGSARIKKGSFWLASASFKEIITVLFLGYLSYR